MQHELPLATAGIVAAEDRVAAWIDQADEFSQAAMFRQLRMGKR